MDRRNVHKPIIATLFYFYSYNIITLPNEASTHRHWLKTEDISGNAKAHATARKTSA